MKYIAIIQVIILLHLSSIMAYSKAGFESFHEDTIGVSVWLSGKDANGSSTVSPRLCSYQFPIRNNEPSGNSDTILNEQMVFVKKVFDALDSIRMGGPSGKALIERLYEMPACIRISYSRSRNAADGESASFLLWNPDLKVSVPDRTGNQSRPAFIGLAHELAHMLDFYQGTLDQRTWKKISVDGVRYSIKRSERFAVYMENNIRLENGFPVREFYGLDDEGKGFLRMPLVSK
ncbi:MAG TPA: M91 family zinc metallopeptidase [Flavisolibacter sp.]|jgi:hypothetical protein|nr:M91 family zinc metallopeptidase [Flavisolibacter sp.]